MMNRKILAVLAVLILVACVPLVISDGPVSGSSDERTAIYVPGDDYYRPIQRYSASEPPADRYYALYSQIEEKDEEFKRCLDEDRLDDFVSTWEPYQDVCVYKKGVRDPTQCAKTFHKESQKTLIPVNSGTCTMEIVKIEQVHGYDVNLSLSTSAGVTAKIWTKLKEGDTKDFTFDSFSTMWFNSDEEIKVTYRLSGSSVPAEYVPTEIVTINSIYAWYRYDVDPGTYMFQSDQVAFIKGSNEEKRFLTEIVDQNRYYNIMDDERNTYHAFERDVGKNVDSAVSIYMLITSVEPYSNESISMGYNSGFISTTYPFERLTRTVTSLYAQADTSFKLAVGGYDMSEQLVYLVYKEGSSWKFVLLAPNVLYTIENSNSKTYSVVSYSSSMSTSDSLYSEITIHTEGLPDKADDNVAAILAGSLIGIGALAFISMYISHRRPGWTGAKADRIRRKNGRDNGGKQSEQEMGQTAPSDENRTSGTEESQTDMSDTGNDTGPRKRRFGRS